jgi:transcriptional regulator with PAS, ATPase and Fis domain
MNIDWNSIAVQPGVHQLGVVLRRQLGIWAGLLTPTGRTIPLGAPDEELIHPLCSCFKANPIPQGDKGEQATCSSSLRQWASQPNAALNLTCHAGLNARIKELVDLRGDYCGAIYVSGFITERNETRALIDIKRNLKSAGYDEEQIEQEWFDVLLRASPIDEGVIGTLLTALQDEAQRALTKQMRENKIVREDSSGQFEGMIGDSPIMRQLFYMIDRVARTNSTVLILGENGTGKELVANAIHRRSRRVERPFLVQNVAAIPGELIESELFGHKRGAFSGAHRDRRGLFEAANHGTFFLDEIGEMDLTLQSKLLRVLQEGTFLPVGEETYRKVDVRMIFATNRDLRQMVQQKTFRDDLYYRINVFALRVPPLRERPSDIPRLARHFLSRATRLHGVTEREFSQDCLQQMMSYEWPGNVRELENEIERMVIMSGSDTEIGVDALSNKVGNAKPAPIALSSMGMTLPEAVEQLEEQMIVAALEDTGWNKTQAAKQLGVSRRNLIRKVSKMGLEDNEDDD